MGGIGLFNIKSKYKFKRELIVGWIVILVAMLPISAIATNYEDLYAGTGKFDYKDGERQEASFRFPYGIAKDQEGNLIVADSYNNVIRKIKGNEVTTIAGFSKENDSLGFPLGGHVDGDVLKAQFNRPRDIAVDTDGNIFVVDTGNHVIRKIVKGKVQTFVGNGKPGYKDGESHVAQFNNPSGIAIDKSNNLFVTDTLNHVIRKITPQGEVTTYAGKREKTGGYKDSVNNFAKFNEPAGIAIDHQGVLYVLDSGNQLVRKVTHQK